MGGERGCDARDVGKREGGSLGSPSPFPPCCGFTPLWRCFPSPLNRGQLKQSWLRPLPPPRPRRMLMGSDGLLCGASRMFNKAGWDSARSSRRLFPIPERARLPFIEAACSLGASGRTVGPFDRWEVGEQGWQGWGRGQRSAGRAGRSLPAPLLGIRPVG